MQFIGWLRTEAKGAAAVRIVYYAIPVLVAMELVTHVVAGLLGVNSVAGNYRPSVEWALGYPHTVLGMTWLLVNIIWRVLIEEVITRFLPLATVVRINPQPLPVLVTSVLASALFGILHGDRIRTLLEGWHAWPAFWDGPIAPLVGFGLSGLVFCGVFLKCGGWQRRPFKALLYSTAFHVVVNAIVFASALVRALA